MAGQNRNLGLTPLSACLLRPKRLKRAFHLDPRLQRWDVTEGGAGVPVSLQITVLRAEDCSPLANAAVEIRHANPQGLYAGLAGQGPDGSVDTTDLTFLHGVQITDADGEADFVTVFPGWTPRSSPHIKLRVFPDTNSVVATDLYFPAELVDTVCSRPPYDRRPRPPERDEASLLREGVEHRNGVLLDSQPYGEGYLAALVIGLYTE